MPKALWLTKDMLNEKAINYHLFNNETLSFLITLFARHKFLVKLHTMKKLILGINVVNNSHLLKVELTYP